MSDDSTTGGYDPYDSESSVHDNSNDGEYDPFNLSTDNPALEEVNDNQEDDNSLEESRYFNTSFSRAGLRIQSCQEDGISRRPNMNMFQLDGNESVEDSDEDSISNYSTDDEVDCEPAFLPADWMAGVSLPLQ